MIIGIDGTNIISGGGVTHLTELIRYADSEKHQFKKVVIWAPQTTLDRLVDFPWLKKCSVNFNESNFISRFLWYWKLLDNLAKNENCSLLFIPGGLVLSRFRPIVTMNQNLLPFSWREIVRYGFSFMTIRLMMLRLIQKRTYRKADGLIFLSNYAKQTVEQITGTLKHTEVIPHGLNKRFLKPYNYNTKSIEKCTTKEPFRILYVSIIDAYKHQWHVVKGISKIRQRTNWPLVLELVGPAYPPSMRRLKKTIDLYDPDSEWVKYYGSVPYEQIQNFYSNADLGIWASSCETFGMILLESMGAGLPIACSKMGTSREILGKAGRYFNPENPDELSKTLEMLILDHQKRLNLSKSNLSVASRYNWELCANQTFEFISKTWRIHCDS